MLTRAEIDFDAVGRLERELREFRAAFADVHDDIDKIDASDAAALERIEGLRRAMEAVYHQPLVFKQEPGSPVARGKVGVDEVLGYVAGLRARKVLGGTVIGTVRAKRIERDGRAVGLEVDETGLRGGAVEAITLHWQLGQLGTAQTVGPGRGRAARLGAGRLMGRGGAG
ncbi:hypothetical protein ACIBSW_35575 [Actinoplanes sp. NPDC049668]|uniref:hypothetical protein n=1 Tax=unclassified Actinoplanes TaxID=2626549 RepID=UPI0033BBB923